MDRLAKSHEYRVAVDCDPAETGIIWLKKLPVWGEISETDRSVRYNGNYV